MVYAFYDYTDGSYTQTSERKISLQLMFIAKHDTDSKLFKIENDVVSVFNPSHDTFEPMDKCDPTTIENIFNELNNEFNPVDDDDSDDDSD